MRNAVTLTKCVMCMTLILLIASGCSAREPEPLDTRTEQEKLFEQLDAEHTIDDGTVSTFWLDRLYDYYRCVQLSEDWLELSKQTYEDPLYEHLPKSLLQTVETRKAMADEYSDKAVSQIETLIDDLENQKLIDKYYYSTLLALNSMKSENEYCSYGYGSTTYDMKQYLIKQGYEFPIDTGVLD